MTTISAPTKKYLNKKLQESHYKPRFKIFKDNSKRFPKDLLLGYEGEVEYKGDNYKELYEATRKVINAYEYLYAKEDGSLNNGCEINTHPFNWAWYLKNDIVKYFDDIANNGFVAERSCGFHVHMSKNFFSHAHLTKLMKLFYGYPKFIEKVSQRVKNQFGMSYCTTDIRDDVLDNLCYDCDYEKEKSEVNFKTFTGCRNAISAVENIHECAINLEHDKTVEVRIFQGTVNKNLIMAYLEFCLAAALYTKYTKFEKVTDKGFRGYVRRNRKKFKNLFNSNILFGKTRAEYNWRKVA